MERTFTLRIDDDLLAAVDAWVAAQAVPPSRGAAIRYLLRRALDAERTNDGVPR